MGKPGSGSGGSTIFTTKISGPPPGTLTTPAEQWIDLGLIPTGYRCWFGNGQYGSPDKSTTFELRTNTTGQSAATTAATLLLGSIVASTRSGTVIQDYYKSNTLHTVSVYGAGVEKFYLRLVSKTSTLGSYLYTLSYTLE